jgi:CheY-like chemotaxis protein
MGKSGTGLGLAVVWNIVQDHEGYIDVKSSKQGTTFEIYLPVIRDDIRIKDIPISINEYMGNGEMVLVVDDEKSQREITCKMVETLGYRSEAVPGGEDAVEYLKGHNADIILLDMIMAPGIGGRETYERIIKLNPKQKAIIVSGFVETDEIKETQRMGAGAYIKKPLILQKLGEAIKEELGRSE